MRIVAEFIGAMIMLGIFAWGAKALVDYLDDKSKAKETKTEPETKDKGETK